MVFQIEGSAPRARSRWLRIGWFYAVGVIAAAQLGKLSALMPLIARDLGLSLTVGALAISLLELGGTLFGRVAGGLVRQVGARTAFISGATLLAVAGVGESFATSASLLLIWRGVESAGYLSTVIAAPLLIYDTADQSEQGTALALWSSFVPVGLALGAVSSGTLTGSMSWRMALLCSGAISVCAAAISLMVKTPQLSHDGPPGPKMGLSRTAWYLALGFGCFTIFDVGFLALLPTYLVERAGSATTMAGLITGIASFTALFGSLLAAWYAHQGHRAEPLMSLSIAMPAFLLFFVYGREPDLKEVSAAAILLNAITGIVAALAFSMLPRIAGHPRNMPQLAGLMTQFGAGGALVGPPIFAGSVAYFGWPSAVICGAIASAFCLGFMTLAQAGDGSQCETS